MQVDPDVAVVGFVVLLGPARIGVFLAPLGLRFRVAPRFGDLTGLDFAFSSRLLR
jgi:hypothetical protein